MADEADISDGRIQLETEYRTKLAREKVLKSTNNLNPTQDCWYCGTKTATTSHRWCSSECRDEWESDKAK